MRSAQVLRGEPAGTEVLQNRPKDRRWSRDVEKTLHIATQLFFDRCKVGGEPVKRGLLIIAARHVARVGRDPPPRVRIEFAAGKLLDRPRRERAKFLVRDRLAAVADEVEIRRQETINTQVVDRRDQLSRGEITRRAKDDHHRRRGAPVFAEPMKERMTW